MNGAGTLFQGNDHKVLQKLNDYQEINGLINLGILMLYSHLKG